MASFQAKISWKTWRKGENKNCLSVPFVLDGKYKIPNKEKKIGWKMPRKRKIKIFFPFPSDRTGNRKFQKKIRKFKKIKKIPLWLHFKQK